MARNWAGLSSAYRTRLERAGISRSDYESGVSSTKARGHGNTPEHPERAESNPAKYPGYTSAKTQLINDIQWVKRGLFQSTGKFNNGNSKNSIKHDPDTGKLRTIQDLKNILKIAEGLKNGTLTWEQFKGSPEWDEYRSAFFYH